MNLENDLVVQCEVCGHVQLIEKDSLDMDSYSYERNMGEEIEYVFSGECQCEYRKFAVSSIAKDKNTRIFYKICVKCLLYLCVIFGKII